MESRKTCFFNHQPVICIYRIIHAPRHLDGQKLHQGPPSYWTPPTASQMPFFRCPDDPPVYGMARVYGMHIQLCNIHIYIYISILRMKIGVCQGKYGTPFFYPLLDDNVSLLNIAVLGVYRYIISYFKT